MMKRALPVILLALAAQPVAAEATWSPVTNHCVTGSLTACLSSKISTQIIDSRTHVSIYIRNIDLTVGYGYRIAGIGLTAPELEDVEFNHLTDITVTGGAGATPNSPETHWTKKLTGIGNNTVFFESATQGSAGGIEGCFNSNAYSDNETNSEFRTCVDNANDGWVVFSFTTGNLWEANDALLAYKIVSVYPTDESLSCPNNDLICTTTVTVPEPLTMLLLGTGLFGVGVISRRRRRDLV